MTGCGYWRCCYWCPSTPPASLVGADPFGDLQQVGSAGDGGDSEIEALFPAIGVESRDDEHAELARSEDGDGLAVLGCRDGWVYAFRASDGQLAWRLRAAPEERLIVDDGQLESAWPVNGSVLVVNGTVYFAAGRSSQLDDGIYLYGLDAATGRVDYKTKMKGPHYNVDNISQNYQLPMGTLPDIMQSDSLLDN